MDREVAECAVCGAEVEAGRALPIRFVGKRWFVCGGPCRVAFKREPERWVAARPEAGRGGEGVAAPPPRMRAPGPFRVR